MRESTRTSPTLALLSLLEPPSRISSSGNSACTGQGHGATRQLRNKSHSLHGSERQHPDGQKDRNQKMQPWVAVRNPRREPRVEKNAGRGIRITARNQHEGKHKAGSRRFKKSLHHITSRLVLGTENTSPSDSGARAVPLNSDYSAPAHPVVW